MLSNNDVLSRSITFLRLPLMVAVVFIHTNLCDVNIGGNLLVAEGAFPILDILTHIVSDEIAHIAVPLFFFISGFLFFFNSDFSCSAYGGKLKKRIGTLLVPYLFWNITVLLLLFFTQTFLSSMTSGSNKLVSDYTLSDYLGIFYNHKDGKPLCYQFWFIRDLMVCYILSPIIYLYVKYGKLLGVSLLGLLWCFGIWFHIAGFSSTSFFFFAFGSWFAINRRNFVVDFKPLRITFSLLYVPIIIISTIL